MKVVHRTFERIDAYDSNVQGYRKRKLVIGYRLFTLYYCIECVISFEREYTHTGIGLQIVHLLCSEIRTWNKHCSPTK